MVRDRPRTRYSASDRARRRFDRITDAAAASRVWAAANALRDRVAALGGANPLLGGAVPPPGGANALPGGASALPIFGRPLSGDAPAAMPMPPKPASSASFYDAAELQNILDLHERVAEAAPEEPPLEGGAGLFDLHELVRGMVEGEEADG